MTPENVLTIEHQDGPRTLALTRGSYSVEDDRIAISIQTERPSGFPEPDVAWFCIHECPLHGHLSAGDTFECHGGLYVEGIPKANAYFGFHAESVYMKWTVMEARHDTVVFRFEARHDDVDYYDGRAKRCPTSGTFTLPERKRSELWIPV